jgi:hypothetical protein
MNHRIYILSLLLWIAGCASTAQRTASIDRALTEIQAGRAEQGRAALEELCKNGVSGACALIGQPTEKREPVPILQSVSANGQSRFVVSTPGRGKFVYYIRSAHGITRLEPEFFARPGAKAGVDQLEAFGLDPKVGYELIVIGSQAQLWDKRSFHSLDLNKRRARLAVASCMDDKYKVEQAKIWSQLLRQKPDVILLIGDNVYVDRGAETPNITADFIWKRYAETRASLALFQADPLIPVMAVWDDHDFAKNDGDRTFALKDETREVFFTFFAQKKIAPQLERGPGISAWWSAFGVHFAFLDDRTFRSPNGLDIPDQTHFGSEQENWLGQQLASTREPVFLISGDQFFGGYHGFESFEGSHPKSFAKQLEEWKKTKAPLLFVSGDRHLTEILKVPAARLGYPTYELTSSGIHAKMFNDAFVRNPSPQQLIGVAGQMNYMIVEVMRAERGFLQLDVQSFTLGGRQLFQKTLTVKHLR